jgi:TetR/AcrR family transcriptional regulator
MPPIKAKSTTETGGNRTAKAQGRARARPQTRIQREKRDLILEAALDVFSLHGFRGATIDQIAEAAGMSKPNLLYYFPRKEAIHKRLMVEMLDIWLAPLRQSPKSAATFAASSK